MSGPESVNARTRPTDLRIHCTCKKHNMHCLGRRHYERGLRVTKGTTLNVKPHVHAGSRQAVRNAKFCACLHVPVAWATNFPPMQVGGDFLLSVGRFAEGWI